MQDQLLSRLESAVSRLERISQTEPTSHAPSISSLPSWCAELDLLVKSSTSQLISSANVVGQQDLVKACTTYERVLQGITTLLHMSLTSRKPESSEFAALMEPISRLTTTIQPDNRSDFFPHIKAIAEACSLAMIITSPSPPTHVHAVIDAVEFHTNKVLRRKIAEETEWVKSLKTLLTGYHTFCNEHFKMGVTWKSQGANALENAGGLNAVISELAGAPALKKVTAEMKTKNREKEEGYSKVTSDQKVKQSVKKICRGPPVCELRRDNWFVENFQEEPLIDLAARECQVTMKQLVYVGNCADSTIKIMNKCKGVTLDSCVKVCLVVNSVISSVELVNCEKVTIQFIGEVPTLSIDKCTGVTVYLSEASLNVSVATSKSSEMNLCVPSGMDGDFVEVVIPEQYSHRLVGTKLATNVSDLYHS